MSPGRNIFRALALAAGVLIVIFGMAGVLIVRSAWFANYVKQTTIAAVQGATGGRVEIGTFRFEWTRLSAVVTNFVVHGNEPPDADPLLRVARVQLNVRLLRGLHPRWDISYLGLDRAEANVIVDANGQTNLPAPRRKSNSPALATVMDLAIGRFDLTNSTVTFAAQKRALNIQGNNLRALLSYNTPGAEYRGQLSLQPIYVMSGKNTPVSFTVNIPVVLARDRIDVNGATVASSTSAVTLSASVKDLNDPKISVHVNGHIALADLTNAMGLPLSAMRSTGPSLMDFDATGSAQNTAVDLSRLRLSLGRSQIEAFGSLSGGITFRSRLALLELGRLANQTALPDEVANVEGIAAFHSNNVVNNGANNASNNITLTRLRASAFGGEFSGDAALRDFSAYDVRGNLTRWDLERALRAAAQMPLPYDGVLSGPIRIAGNLNVGLPDLTAYAQLSIAPGSQGIPLTGNVTADYRGASDDITIQKSLLLLPHSRLSLDGSVGKRLNVALATTDLDDLFAVIPQGSRPPVALRGPANFMGTITGTLREPHIAGHVAATRFSVAGRAFDSFGADASATPQLVAIQNGSLGRSAMQAHFSGTLGLQEWKPLPNAPLSIDASIPNGDLADLLALAGQPSSGYSGQLSADANITGTLQDPQGAVSVTVTNGVIQSQPFDRAEAHVNLADQSVSVPSAVVQLGQAHVNLTAEFRHPRDSFTMGQLRADLQSDRIDLAQVKALQKLHPNTAGVIELHANATGDVRGVQSIAADLQLTNLNVNATVRGLRSEGQNYGDLTATAATSGPAVNYDLVSNFAGSNMHLTGNTQLARDYPTTARAEFGNLPVERVLALADRADIPVQGALSGTANLAGTMRNPQGSADVVLAKGTIYDNTVDRVHARVDYRPLSVDLSQLEIVSGHSHVDLSARFDHPADHLDFGSLQFRADSNGVDLANIKTLTDRRSGLGGNVQAHVSGAAQIQSSGPRVLMRELSGNIKTTSLALDGKNLGDVALAADTTGDRFNVTLGSRLAGSTVEGSGSVQLAHDYPASARLTFKNVTWAGLRPLLGSDFGAGFEAVGDGEASLNGPLTNTHQLRGSLQVTRLQVNGAASPLHANNPPPVLLQNQGPLAMTLDGAALKIQSARVHGPQTDFQATGTVPLDGQAVNLALQGNVNLAILQQFDPSISSAGTIVLTAGVQGSLAKPSLTGQIALHDASFNHANLPIGIWKANGAIALNGNGAAIRSLTAESGGGQVSVTGYATMNGALRFGLEAKASRVRMLVEEGVGVVSSADLTLSGTAASSLLSGSVTIEQISYAAKSDLGSLLSLAAPPVQIPPAPSPLLENMRLDVRVRNSSALGVQSSVGQNLQLTGDLRVRGSASNPGILGRVVITQGKLVFFGSTYTVNTGNIAFYNPIRIEPILDFSLQTEAQGVNVTLKVTGPLNNLKLSYTSDPPLQFQEIVGLLAAGTTPASDPTLLANQPALPAQSFQQIGESAILGRALADPVTNQLQRVFGVTQLKINPAFVTNSQIPAAQVALQQQITSNIAFTYVTTFNTANAETIQAVWTFTPEWSAQALRDYTGIFSVIVVYKRQFR